MKQMHDSNGNIVWVHGGFTAVGHIGLSGIENLSCTCGWSMACHGVTDDEAIEAAKEHGLHKNYIKTANLYQKGELSYDGALNFLMIAGMEEDKAEAYLDAINT